MKQFLRRISPKRAVLDFMEVWQTPQQHRWPVMGVALAATFALFMLFIPESQRIEPRPPEVIYVSTWEEGRTERQIIASNCRNQELKDALQARLDERAEIRRDMYRALGRATFIDVDEIEANAEAEAAAAEAEEQAAREAVGLDDGAYAMSVEEYCAQALGDAAG